jgi:hypothetical protein
MPRSYAAANAIWRMRRETPPRPVPTIEDLCCRIYTVTFTNGPASVSYPLLAADAAHARTIATTRAKAGGYLDHALTIRDEGAPHELPEMMAMLLGNETIVERAARLDRIRR